MSEKSPISSRQRVYEQLRSMAAILESEPDGLRVREVMNRLRDKLPPTEAELTTNASGAQRYETNARWWSTNLVKAGWIVKQGGVWTLTPLGRQALQDYPDSYSFGDESERLYQAWRAARKELAVALGSGEGILPYAVLELVPRGRWVSFTDLATATNEAPQPLGARVWNDRPSRWHVLLRSDGSISADQYDAPDRAELQRRLLEEEGIEASPRAPAELQLSLSDLQTLVSQVRLSGRAWLIRGTSVKGASIVPEWLDEDFVSLPASQLSALPDDPSDADIRSAVDAGYDTLGYSQRQAKFEDVRAFVKRMKKGHLVVAGVADDIYVGTIAGECEQVESPGRRSNLRRTVEWANEDSPLSVSDIPARLEGKLRTPSDVVDLTDVYEDVLGLLTAGDLEDPPTEEAVLIDLDDDTCARLLIDSSWLHEFVSVLRMKKQVILYGPPGTGKTFLAQEVAEALGGKGHVTLVQFHPSYSYEDFFEGYRPAGGTDGGVSLQLVPGPFRKVVDLARANPTEPYFLIIDEINRANLAKVFGELYFLLEYRDRSIELLYSSGDTGPAFSLPANVYIIGTMNTADRSIALVDAAMRRRFAFLSLHPEDEKLDLVLRAWLAERGLPEERADLLVELNRRIADKDFKIGPSYLMNQWAADDAGLVRIWKTSILPLLAEYHIGDGVDVDAKYGLAGIRKALGAVGSNVTAGDAESE